MPHNFQTYFNHFYLLPVTRRAQQHVTFGAPRVPRLLWVRLFSEAKNVSREAARNHTKVKVKANVFGANAIITCSPGPAHLSLHAAPNKTLLFFLSFFSFTYYNALLLPQVWCGVWFLDWDCLSFFLNFRPSRSWYLFH